ncbi:MAG: putative ABC transporter permease subunit [Dethiobacteria bacterium]|jgi:ABC-2 type transport system permease protein
MKILTYPPLTQPPAPQSFNQDLRLLLGNQLRVSYNKMRHWPLGAWLSVGAAGLGFLAFIIYLGFLAYGALKVMPPEIGKGFLALVFMVGVAGQLFFGVTAAFVTMYMSEDLELLFVSPVPLRVIFTVKSLVVAGSNLLTAILFCFLPAIFYGLLFQAGFAYYLFVLLVGCGLWIMGTALAILLNLVVMRIVPPHRSREAVGLIGALTGIMVAIVAQLPNIIMHGGQQVDVTDWLAGQEAMLRIMGHFPWGWGSQALAEGISGNLLNGLGWSLLLLFAGVSIFLFAFSLLEKGFRRGWVSIGQIHGNQRRKNKHRSYKYADKNQNVTFRIATAEVNNGFASPIGGMWAVAKKDLLYMRRDTREWFGYMMPLLLMIFFVAQFLFFQSDAMQTTMVMVLIIYSVMFSGNMALQSFGREGESEWLLNSVPLAGWPVVLGKLLGAVIPTLVLMEALLAGTALALGVSASLTLMLAVAAILLTLGASAIGLFYSINNCRYNPDSPQQRISPGASMLMYITNFLFMLILALGIVYLMPPVELMAVLPELSKVTMKSSFFNGLISIFIYLGRPLLWPSALRIIMGLIVTFGTWFLVFFGFMAATVRQSDKGFRVELVTGSKKKPEKRE